MSRDVLGGAPDANQWLAADLGARTARVVVAGVAGGVGATTLAALVARAVARARPGRVALVDHTGGTLAERAGTAPGDAGWAAPTAAQVSVECAGPTALLPGATAVRAPAVLPVVVAPWHPEGLRLGERAVAGLPGALLVAVDHARAERRPRSSPDHLGLPYDAALGVPGAVRDDLLDAPAREAVLAVALESLARAGGRALAP
ncbi:hypothetical protein [Promicromonospora sp. NPDC057488]|uniref:hypothetical protein n=1 Tax=Promicromonospora sp. NPDC057488 TaxID=3346147 RepID=UPI003671C89E